MKRKRANGNHLKLYNGTIQYFVFFTGSPFGYLKRDFEA